MVKLSDSMASLSVFGDYGSKCSFVLLLHLIDQICVCFHMKDNFGIRSRRLLEKMSKLFMRFAQYSALRN